MRLTNTKETQMTRKIDQTLERLGKIFFIIWFFAVALLAWGLVFWGIVNLSNILN